MKACAQGQKIQMMSYESGKVPRAILRNLCCHTQESELISKAREKFYGFEVKLA